MTNHERKNDKIETPSTIKERFRASIYKDLLICLVITLITIPLVLFVPENAIISDDALEVILGVIRLSIGIILIFFLPGYLLVTILWPISEKDDLWRFGIAFGLSLVIIPILGLILNFTPAGLNSHSILAGLLIISLILWIIALIRRIKLEKDS